MTYQYQCFNSLEEMTQWVNKNKYKSIKYAKIYSKPGSNLIYVRMYLIK